MLSLHKITPIERHQSELPKKINKKPMIIVLSVFLMALIFSGKFWHDSNNDKEAVKKISVSSFQEKTAVLGEEDISMKGDKLVTSSENFRAIQINLNDGIGSNMTEFEESSLLEIGDIKSELYSIKDGDKNEVKAIISCKTSKKAFIGVKYFKSGEKNGKMVKSAYSGFSHTIIVPALDIDSVYKYSISAVDIFGNKAGSEQLVFYTGAPNISLVDTLENAFRKVFGWALGG